jgi:uncharacterized protein
MPYLPEGAPLPDPGPDEIPFFEACARRELRLQRCADCGRFRHPPSPRCPECRSARIEWEQISGEGEVFSYTIVHHAVHKALKGTTPYNVVLVALDGTNGARLVSNLVDTPYQDVHVGQRVSLFWDEVPGGWLPRFTRSKAVAAT